MVNEQIRQEHEEGVYYAYEEACIGKDQDPEYVILVAKHDVAFHLQHDSFDEAVTWGHHDTGYIARFINSKHKQAGEILINGMINNMLDKYHPQASTYKKQGMEGYLCKYANIVIEHAFKQIQEQGLTDEPMFCPEALKRQDFLDKIKQARDGEYKEAVDFIAATSSRDFIARMAAWSSIPKWLKAKESLQELYERTGPHDPSKKMLEKILAKPERDLGAFNDQNKLHAMPKPVARVKGIFFDVDGTLFGPQEKAVRAFFKKCAETGGEVYIFTGGNIARQTERLQKIGIDTARIPVLPKDAFVSERIAFSGHVIDNENPLDYGLFVPGVLYYDDGSGDEGAHLTPADIDIKRSANGASYNDRFAKFAENPEESRPRLRTH